MGNRRIVGITLSNQKFVAFSIGDLNFKYSFQSTANSLDNLVNNLSNKHVVNNFTFMRS